MERTILKVTGLLFLLAILLYPVRRLIPISISRYSEVKLGNSVINKIEDYRKEKELPKADDWVTLKALGFKDNVNSLTPAYRKLNAGNYELSFPDGTEGPYLLWNSREKVWNINMPATDTVAFQTGLEIINGLAYKIGDLNPFTGVAVDHYVNGNKKQEITYENGETNGLWTQWNENGEKLSEVSYDHGTEVPLGIIENNAQHHDFWRSKQWEPMAEIIFQIIIVLAIFWFFPFGKVIPKVIPKLLKVFLFPFTIGTNALATFRLLVPVLLIVFMPLYIIILSYLGWDGPVGISVLFVPLLLAFFVSWHVYYKVLNRFKFFQDEEEIRPVTSEYLIDSTKWMQNGISCDWHENGQKKAEGKYINGSYEGLWTWWDEKGNKVSEENYIHGLADGVQTSWYLNGQKKSEAHFVKGNLEGTLTMWHDNGKKASEKNYRNGKEVSSISWDKDGKETKSES